LSAENSTSFSKDKGHMLENTVFLQLRRKFKELYYFKEQNECDFLVKEKDKITQAIQVSYQLTEDNLTREKEGLLQAMKKTKLSKGTIITLNQQDTIKEQGKKINVLPVWKWLTSQ
jgi:predicted AAA+ superfamily ATPase